MVSSARNPNESYADRAKKASTSSAPRTAHNQTAANAPPPPPPSSSLKPPQANVWAERIKEQQAHAAPQPAQMPRQRATSSPQPSRDEPILPRSPALPAKLAVLDHKDQHDPFIVRVPPHLSRHSSSSTNPATDSNAWPLLTRTASAGNDSPFLSAPPSRQNSTASVRHHAYSPSGSTSLSRVQSSLSQRSRSASQSRAQSGSGSSASSPRLQIRGRTLPLVDSLPPDLRLDGQQQRRSFTRSSPALPDPPNSISTAFQIDPAPLPADPPFYRRPPVPPLQDMSPRFTHNLVPQYALPPHFPPAHLPGHASPPYIPHSGQGTPPYSHYPPFPAYMYGHPPFYWGDIPSHLHNHSHNQLPIHANASDHPLPHKIEFGSLSPLVTTEPSASRPPAQFQNASQPRPSKGVVFGTINPAESQNDAPTSQPSEEQRPDAALEHATEQFAAFSIGVSPHEPGPSRHASRKSSIKSLSKMHSTQSATNDAAKDAGAPSLPSREVNGVKKPVKWEFGTTLSEDLDEPQPSSPHVPPSALPPDHETEHTDDRPDQLSPLHDIPPADRSMDKSETASTTSDVWVVKDFGYGFGDYSGCGNAPEVVRLEMRERERERARARESYRERDVPRDQHRDRSWTTPVRHGLRHENGVEEIREAWEQQAQVEAPRHVRPRRGSFSGYDRGGFPGRRGRGFGGRFHGRGRGGFFHHQRPGSYPFAPPPPPPPPPFEMLPPPIDTINGYGPYAPPELESYEAAAPLPQPRVQFTPAYPVEMMRNCLLAQLEYYLSPQNMAQDFYLRQRMDNEGWIPISLLASFKRVQQLQTDADIVRDVLSRSAVFEVSGDWVRMGGRQWEPFVLPNARRSVVTGFGLGEGEIPRAGLEHQGDTYAEHDEIENGEIEGDGEDCEGDDEDDDIEFVIGEEAEGSWMVPERRQ